MKLNQIINIVLMSFATMTFDSLQGSSLAATKPISITNLTCEHMVDPVGIGTTVPRLSWILTSEIRDQEQTAYQVLVASSPDLLNRVGR
jgi:hypothetical protein